MSVVSPEQTSPPAPPPQSPPHPFLDPELAPATLNSLSAAATSSSHSNPLNEFAQQVLGAEEDAENLLGFGRGGHNMLEEQSFGDLLQSEERREARDSHEGLDGDRMNHDAQENDTSAVDFQGLPEGEIGINLENHELGENAAVQQQGIYGGRIAKRRRIGGGEETLTDANGQPLEPQEYARLKRDSHKEVERRRRENINDGINEIAHLIPGGMDKQGKGMLLKRAATYIIELVEKAARMEEDGQKRDVEKQDLEAQIAHLQSQLQDEHARSMRFETSWREAEDRAASSNFELERLKLEVEELKGAQGQAAEA
ncbi:hypothetical protein IAU60_003519 [Kwoniella sp. DSM 27419]